MEGICKCGGRIRERSHQVTTQAGIERYDVTCPLPATIETSECRACGRCMVRITDAAGERVEKGIGHI